MGFYIIAAHSKEASQFQGGPNDAKIRDHEIVNIQNAIKATLNGNGGRPMGEVFYADVTDNLY